MIWYMICLSYNLCFQTIFLISKFVKITKVRVLYLVLKRSTRHTGKRGAKLKMRTWESYWKSTTFHHQILINGHLHIQQQITVKQHRSFLNTIHIARMHCRLTKVTENYNNILFGNLCVEFLYDLSSKLNKERHPSWCSLR